MYFSDFHKKLSAVLFRATAIAMLSIFCQQGYGQNVVAQKKADYDFQSTNYYYALENYLKIYDKKPNDPATIEKILICNKFLRNYNDVLTWSEQLTRLDSRNIDYKLEHAQALRSLGNYVEAKAAYREYEALVPEKKKEVDLIIHACDSGIKWMKHPSPNMHIQNVAALNTGYADFGLTLFGAGGFMFSSDRKNDEAQHILASGGSKKEASDLFGGTGRPYIKLYFVSRNADSSWAAPAFFSKLITERYHTSSASFDEKNNILYFTRTRKIEIPKSFNQSTFRAELVYSEAFREIKPFPYNSTLNYSVGDPCITKEGKKLYFSSDMPGGYGGSDLYYCDMQSDGTWGRPINLGPNVNTAGADRFPTLVGDSVLYFSSDGHVGMGGLDIFSSVKTRAGWGIARNLGYPLNSPEDDFSMLIMKSTSNRGRTTIEGYFSSDRPGGKGSDDIYEFKTDVPQTHNVFFVQGKITDKESGEALTDVKLDVKDQQTSNTETFATDSAGKYSFPVQKNKKYEVLVKRPKFYAKKEVISTKGMSDKEDINLDVKLEPEVINKPVRLDNIYYGFNEWKITQQAASVLNGLIKTLSDNPEIDVELSSHTDTRGDDIINKYISQQRAQAAVNYLISKGIDTHRIYAKGYGREQPLVKCGNDCSDEDHALNRRTEFKIVKIVEHASK